MNKKLLFLILAILVEISFSLLFFYIPDFLKKEIPVSPVETPIHFIHGFNAFLSCSLILIESNEVSLLYYKLFRSRTMVFLFHFSIIYSILILTEKFIGSNFFCIFIHIVIVYVEFFMNLSRMFFEYPLDDSRLFLVFSFYSQEAQMMILDKIFFFHTFFSNFKFKDDLNPYFYDDVNGVWMMGKSKIKIPEEFCQNLYKIPDSSKLLKVVADLNHLLVDDYFNSFPKFKSIQSMVNFFWHYLKFVEKDVVGVFNMSNEEFFPVNISKIRKNLITEIFDSDISEFDLMDKYNIKRRGGGGVIITKVD